MIEFTPVSSMIGGLLIGVSATLLLKFNGRIAGISGILTGVMSVKTGDRLWRVAFLAGLVMGGVAYQWVSGSQLVSREDFSWVQLVLAGVLVGFGTRLGSGCTSGHGVIGIARLSPRSMVATLTFVLTGMISASTMSLIIRGAA